MKIAKNVMAYCLMLLSLALTCGCWSNGGSSNEVPLVNKKVKSFKLEESDIPKDFIVEELACFNSELFTAVEGHVSNQGTEDVTNFYLLIYLFDKNDCYVGYMRAFTEQNLLKSRTTQKVWAIDHSPRNVASCEVKYFAHTDLDRTRHIGINREKSFRSPAINRSIKISPENEYDGPKEDLCSPTLDQEIIDGIELFDREQLLSIPDKDRLFHVVGSTFRTFSTPGTYAITGEGAETIDLYDNQKRLWTVRLVTGQTDENGHPLFRVLELKNDCARKLPDFVPLPKKCVISDSFKKWSEIKPWLKKRINNNCEYNFLVHTVERRFL